MAGPHFASGTVLACVSEAMADPISPALAALPPKPLPEPSAASRSPVAESSAETSGSFWGHDGPMTFGDFIDLINPLQHIPVVSTIYRAITGDEIGAGARAIGGLIYGGPAGMLTAGLTSLFEEASGGTVVSHVASLIDDLTGDGPPAAASAENPDDVRSAQQQAALPPQSPTAGPAAGPAATPVAALPQILAQTLAQTMPAGVSAAGANRIAYNPMAALGVPQAIPAAPAAQSPATAQAQPVAGGQAAALPARPVGLQFASAAPAQAPVFPAHPGRMPARAASPSQAPVQSVRANAAVEQAQQLRADRMLARWAAQQAALQAAPAPSPAAAAAEQRTRNAPDDPAPLDRAAAPAAAHPMLAPQNANPDWYVQAMSAALARYQTAQGTAAGPALAGQPALPR